jgi:hypothetical protein
MTVEPMRAVPPLPEAEAFVRQLVDDASTLRMPEIFDTPPPDAVYTQQNRHGVVTVVLRSPSLTEGQLIKLMRYRLAQYAIINFVDADMIYEARLEHEPLSNVAPGDIHVLSGSAETGEILCYAAIKAPPAAVPGTTLRSRDRPHFPVEKVHGWGVFNRLLVLPDLPFHKLFELGRFVKNQRLHTFDELGARAPVEVGVALFRALAGPLRLEVDAIIGDLEEGVAKQNLDFFHVPLIVIHGTVPFEAEASYFYPRYQYSTVYPFAVLASDISRQMLSRLDAIEEALEHPGKTGLLGLFKLKRDIITPKSTLEPPEGLDPLSDANVPQIGVPMADRLMMIDLASRLRQSNLFAGLSMSEATVLGTFMERQAIEAGDVIIREGDIGDDLFLIESGTADVIVARGRDLPIHVATLGPGDFFGEIALLTGAERMADVVASSPMSLLRLTKDAFTHYLTHATEVDRQITRTAMSRTRDTSRRITGERN